MTFLWAVPDFYLFSLLIEKLGSFKLTRSFKSAQLDRKAFPSGHHSTKMISPLWSVLPPVTSPSSFQMRKTESFAEVATLLPYRFNVRVGLLPNWFIRFLWTESCRSFDEEERSLSLHQELHSKHQTTCTHLLCKISIFLRTGLPSKKNSVLHRTPFGLITLLLKVRHSSIHPNESQHAEKIGKRLTFEESSPSTLTLF